MLSRRAPESGVTLVAIVKGEEAFIDEWIAYHRLIGFDRLILYDNDPALPLRSLLRRHGERVRVIDWAGEHRHLPGRNKQTKAYTDSLRHVEDPWVAFLDGDEFLVLRRHETVGELLADLVREARPRKVDAVQLRWHLFGPNGHRENPPGLVTSALTRRRREPGRMTKSITRVGAIRKIDSAHSCRLQPFSRSVDANGRRITSKPYPGLTDVAHVNHYLCRSYESWMSRLERGEAAFPSDRPPTTPEHRWRFDRELCRAKFFEIERLTDEMDDDHMLRWAEPIQEYLAALPDRGSPPQDV